MPAREKQKPHGNVPSQGHPALCDHDYSADEMEFLQAIQEWQQRTGIKFPLWSDVLGIVRSLGYRK